MSVHRNNPEDEQCYGSCFACIPTCPRHPENSERHRDEASDVVPGLSTNPQEDAPSVEVEDEDEAIPSA